VRLRDPSTGIAQLFVPGGAIEPGETPQAAALRETLEETGYRVGLRAAEARTACYPFVWNGVAFSVTTHFFAVELLAPQEPPRIVVDDAYNEAVIWLPCEQIEHAFGFHAEILAAVQAVMRLF
jgi:8-oxo-dGTP pyrophosphatase MutT (NUDIX family)